MGRIGNILTNVVLDEGGNGSFNYLKVTKFSDGTDMDDSKVIAPMYIKVGTEYFNMIHYGAMNVKWFNVTGDGTTNDLENLQIAFNFAARTYRHITLPPGKYFCGYTTPLVIKGDTLVVEGSGSPTNASGDFGTIIYGNIQIGDTTTDTTRGVLQNLGIRGPGWSDQIERTTQSGIGVLAVKALEFKMSNVSVEGFKYGFSPYEDPTISILQVNTITIDHCRFYNNKICNIEMGRGGHAFTVTNGTNTSLSDYNIVIGVFNKSNDTIIWDNNEPVFSVTISNGNTIQAWFKSGIVVTNSKKVTIRDNYFELGMFFQNSDEAILLGSSVPKPSFNPKGGGYEYNVAAPVITGNWFFLMTALYSYKVNSCCIRVINVKGGEITCNHLVNLPGAGVGEDPQSSDVYLIKDDQAILSENIQYFGNVSTFSREKTEEYQIEDRGFSTYHNSYTFGFVSDKPKYLNLVGNKVLYNGVYYIVSLLTGDDPYASTASFGATIDISLKFPQVLNNSTTIII